ncbi:hypothetical protein T09_9820 [Trichinella sp. T9]|nr:hypothetical protein T09_11697 [Trichinella sp. T9]KRX29765.1 hypothetical protein T09_9820 [Trichinella sp. T9]
MCIYTEITSYILQAMFVIVIAFVHEMHFYIEIRIN